MTDDSHAQLATDWVNRNTKYTKGTRSVLLTMAGAYGKDGTRLSMGDIARRANVSIATAHRATRKLAEDRVIAVIPNGGDYRRGGLTNRYQFYDFDLSPINSDTPSIISDDTLYQKSDTPSIINNDTPSLRKGAHEIDFGVWGKFEVSDVIPSIILDDTPSIIFEPHTRAAGEIESLSLSSPAVQDLKDKGLAAFAANADLEAPITPETNKPVRPVRARNVLFDAIAQHIFDIPLSNAPQINAAAVRIGKMLKNFPADKTILTPERIQQFARWWDANKRTPDGKPLSKPLDAGKLAKHWSDFEGQCPVKSTAQSTDNAARMEENRRYLEQERLKQREFMLGGTTS